MLMFTDRKKYYFAPVFALLFCHAILAPGCSRRPARISRLQWCSMGTFAAVQSADSDTAERLRTVAATRFSQIETELSAWDPESTLSQVNRAAGSDRAVPVSDAFLDVLRIATTMNHHSAGAFNPLLGPVLHLWGFGSETTPTATPDRHALHQAFSLAECSALSIVAIDGHPAVKLARPGMRLDFGAVAKGYAVDLAWQDAQRQGLSNALIDLGGNLRALGEARPGRGGWLTGVKDPFNPDRLIARLLLRDGEAVATSGNYERFVEINGERCAHIIDGRTAMPVKGIAAVTVIAPDAATADALSTALFILGAEQGERLLADHYPDSLALWIPDRQPAAIIASEKMEVRLDRTAFP